MRSGVSAIVSFRLAKASVEVVAIVRCVLEVTLCSRLGGDLHDFREKRRDKGDELKRERAAGQARARKGEGEGRTWSVRSLGCGLFEQLGGCLTKVVKNARE